jgi:hypothetical protein
MTIVETNAEGDLLLPAALLGAAGTHREFEVQVAGETVVLRPVEGQRPFWERATPDQRAAAFRQWAATCPPVPPLPDSAFQRDNWYD